MGWAVAGLCRALKAMERSLAFHLSAVGSHQGV